MRIRELLAKSYKLMAENHPDPCNRRELFNENVELREKLAVAVKSLEGMHSHICDGGGDFPCSQMWYQDVIEEALDAIRGDSCGS